MGCVRLAVQVRASRPMENLYYEKLVNASLRFVSYRPRSEKELKEFLTKKIIKWKLSGALLVQKVIDRMRELGYIDDEKFAVWWLGQRTTFKLKGNRVIELELRAKGVPKAIIDPVLATREPQSALEDAKKAIARKEAIWAKLPPLERKKKLYDYLGRRGFDFDTIAKLIDAEK